MDEERQTRERRLWAIFSNEEEGQAHRISDWMPKEKADAALTCLHEDGEMNLFLMAEDG